MTTELQNTSACCETAGVGTGDLLGRILAASAYPPDWQISERETEEMLRLCKEGLCTLNGDTAPVTITVRQLLLLLRRHAEARWPNTPVTDAETSTPANTRAQSPRSV